MSEPRCVTLGVLGSLTRGKGGTKKDERPDGVPCLRYGELYTVHDVRVRRFVSFVDPERASSYTALRSGDIVFAGSGETHEEIGQAAVFIGDEHAVVGSDTVIFRPGPEAHPVFLGYAVNRESAARFKSRMGQGSSVIHISPRHLEQLPVWLPALPEQQAVAQVLDILDTAILKTEEILAKLRQLKKGLLHDLLTRGIDDNGELRDPARYPEQLKDSGLGRIPRTWDLALLHTIAEIRSGIAKNSKKATSDGVQVPYLRVANVQDGYVDLTDIAEIGVGRANLDRYRVLSGDVLMNEGGDLDKLGRGVLWTGQIDPCVHQNHVFAVRPGPRILPAFLDAWTGGPQAKRYFMKAGKQTTNLASINKKDLGTLRVLLPPQVEQQAIVRALITHDQRETTEVDALSKLRSLRTGLSEDLLTGRVRVTALLKEATP